MNRHAAVAGVVAGVLAGGAGGALAATGEGTSGPAATTTATSTAMTNRSPAAGWARDWSASGSDTGDWRDWDGAGSLIQVAARYLGMTENALTSQLHHGTPLAQVARSHGKSVSALETALSVALEHDLDANTDLRAAQRSTLLSQGHGWIATFVNSSCGGTRAQGGWWG